MRLPDASLSEILAAMERAVAESDRRRVMTLEDVCQYLSVSERTARPWMGQLLAYGLRPLGGPIRQLFVVKLYETFFDGDGGVTDRRLRRLNQIAAIAAAAV